MSASASAPDPDPAEEEQLFSFHMKDGKKRRTILENTEIYQMIYQEGIQEARQAQQEWMADFRSTILGMVRELFPDLIDFTQVCLEEVDNSIHLVRLYSNIASSRTSEEARQALEDKGASRIGHLETGEVFFSDRSSS